MAAPRFFSEIFSRSTRILITRHHHPLLNEVVRQLKQHSQFSIVEMAEPNFEDLPSAPVEIIIHAVGLDVNTLAETLYHTSTLHRLMDYALRNNSKFILVVSDSHSHLNKTAIDLLTQFGKAFHLNYIVLSISKQDKLTEVAESIVKSFMRSHQYIQPVSLTHRTLLPKPKPEMRRPKNTRKYLLWAFFGLVVVPGLVVAIELVTLVSGLTCAHRNLSLGSWNSVRRCTIMARTVSGLLATQFVAVPNWRDLFAFSGQVAQIYRSASDIGLTGQTLLSGLFSEQAPLAGLELAHLQVTVAALGEPLAQVQAEAQHLASVFPGLASRLLSVDQRLAGLRMVMGKTGLLLPHIGAWQGSQQEKTIMVLLQDDAEIRPTGGYLGNVLLIRILAGKATEIEVYETSELDGMLMGHVDPPAALTTALGERNWYLRDSNWDPSFVESGYRAAWFLEKELGVLPDAVVGLNLTTLADILGVVGPIEIAEPNLVFTADNFWSTYLGNLRPDKGAINLISKLTSGILAKLPELSVHQWQRLAVVLVRSLETRQALIYVPGEAGHALAAAGWDGGLGTRSCKVTEGCVSEYVYWIESNVGINKANAYVQSEYATQIMLGESQVISVLTAKFSNSGNQTNWPAGNYKNYQRLYLPPQTFIEQVILDNQVLVPGQYQLLSEPGVTALGILVNVAPGATSELVVRTRRPEIMSDQFHFQLVQPNQPGLAPVAVETIISYPSHWQAQPEQAPSIASSGKLLYNTSLRQPAITRIEFIKNGQ